VPELIPIVAAVVDSYPFWATWSRAVIITVSGAFLGLVGLGVRAQIARARALFRGDEPKGGNADAE
jgi:hypothetical protein